MEKLSIKLSPRTVTGKKVKQLRRAGLLPVHFYGEGAQPLSLQAEVGVMRKLVPRAGANIPVAVQIDGQTGENICFIREIQRHPVTDDLLHVDFLRLDVTHRVSADVPVEVVGESPAVERKGGVLMLPFQYLFVEALPLDMPQVIQIDISVLDDFEKSITIADIKLPAGVTIARDPEEMVAKVTAQTISEEEEGAEEAEEGAADVEATEQKDEESEGNGGD